MASEQHLRPPHPRRPIAQRSVSLLQHRPSSSKNSRSTQTDPSSGSPSSTKPVVSKGDSNESSNADTWFESSNNNATGNNRTVVDNDPPFFLRHSSSEETPLDADTGIPCIMNQPGPLRGPQFTSATEDSGSSDFRAVIDDLTIRNKKLRRRLKKYEKLHDAHLKDEKLFEVRVHGLSSTKRRELEEMLRKFAIGAAGQSQPTGSTTSNLYERVVPALKTHKTASSSSNFADSAYASNSASASASGQGSTGMSNSNSSGQQSRPVFRRSAQSRHSNIQTYLHDIPEGLLPQHPSVMTEKAKKKLVVRRLEQLFAGTGATIGDHHHPLQQQEVSQLAATADRRALEATGKIAGIEGNREAPIMKDDGEDRSNQKTPEEEASADVTQGIALSHKVGEQDFATSSPEQRPTRPLDLDPHRAQNPFDNILYMSHLGFSPPDVHSMEAHEEGHGWIYLNFLFNMAQLHTLNVTPDFAKKALLEYSSQFELSEDGRKVRWRGGRKTTRTTSETEEGSPSYSPKVATSKSPLKRSKSSHHKSDQGRYSKRQMVEKQDNKFVYTPLFFHRSSDDDDTDDSSSEDDETESQFLAPPGGDSSAMTSSGVRTVSMKQKKKADNGPIIFYNNAKFCTDLSGEPKTEVSMLYNPIMYHATSEHVVGIPQEPVVSEHGVLETRGPLNDANHLPEAMDLEDNPIPETLEVKFPSATPFSSSSGQSGSIRSPMVMEASGVGGLCPSDNFSINVKTKLARSNDVASSSGQRKRYPAHIAEILKKNGYEPKAAPLLKEDVIKTTRQDLPPSELPPASFWMQEYDDDDDGSDAESYQSISPDVNGNHDVPSTAPQTIDMHFLDSDDSDASDEEEVESGAEDDGKSDGSLDLLATARQLDPESVQAREREYDAHMAERLAEEIPAGSSAATAGGGSGFASPASGVGQKEYEAARTEYAMRQSSKIPAPPTFQRAQTSDSMVVNGKSP